MTVVDERDHLTKAHLTTCYQSSQVSLRMHWISSKHVGLSGLVIHSWYICCYVEQTSSIMSTPTVEYTTGKRGKENALVDGQRYTFNRKRNGTDGVTKSYWVCLVPGCSGRLVLHNRTVKNTPVHNHGEQRAEITVHRSKKTLKHRAAT